MTNSYRAALAGVCFLVGVSGVRAEPVAIETDKQKLSYAWGFSIGQVILRDFGAKLDDLDRAAISQALQDVVNQNKPAMEVAEIQAVLQAQQQKDTAEQQATANAASERGDAFLKQNGARDGVITTDSGLQYEVLAEGAGAQPTEEDTVVVHYRGTLIDGTEFDSSYKRDNPAEFPLTGIIKGWSEALQLMKTGAKWKVAIPSGLAYGPRGAGNAIGPNETLIFEIELLEIK